MDYDRHRIWREVGHIYSHLEANAPAGFQPVVQVYLAGREQPVEPAIVEARQAEDYPWVKLYTGDEERGYVFVHESHIHRIEVTFLRRSGAQIGFVVEESKEADSTGVE
jgi:hypothetical protein